MGIRADALADANGHAVFSLAAEHNAIVENGNCRLLQLDSVVSDTLNVIVQIDWTKCTDVNT